MMNSLSIRLSILLSALFLLGGLAGCSKTRPIQGKWSFDREFTTSQLPPQPETKANDALSAMKSSLVAMLIPQLIDKLDGAALTITDKELIMTVKGGAGQARTFEVVEQPSGESWVLKTSDGEVQTLSREGDRLSTQSSGDVHIKLYFKRVDH